jgi:hypothetical protein
VSQPTDECFRCGYSLIGIANDQACPECGLIAERSRRVTDELHETRPGWLRSLAIGVSLILLAIVLGASWPLAIDRVTRLIYGSARTWQQYQFVRVVVPHAWLGIAAVCLVAGVFFLTIREGYEPADQPDGGLRKGLRYAAWAPLVALTFLVFQAWIDWNYPRYAYYSANTSRWQPAELAALIIATIGSLPFPLLLFARLRGLASRARSAHLAEHCQIVGIGTTLALVYAGVAWWVIDHGDEWFGDYWFERSKSVIVVALVMCLLACLFVLWSLYLMIRFALAFRRASRELRRKWKADDRALPQAESLSHTPS